MEADDGIAAKGGFQEEEVLGVVVEEIFAEGAGAVGVFEEDEVGFKVGVAVGVSIGGLVLLYSTIDSNSHCRALEGRFYKIYIDNR